MQTQKTQETKDVKVHEGQQATEKNQQQESIAKFDDLGFDSVAQDAFHALDRMAERFGVPSLWTADPFFENRLFDSFEKRFSKMIQPFKHEFDQVGRNDKFYDHTKKIFDEFAKNNTYKFKENDPETEMLTHPKELEDLYKRYKAENPEGKVHGHSYVSSTIYKDGKAVNVSRHSDLNPEGVIKSKLHQEFSDETGRTEAQSMKRKFEVGEGEKKDMIKDKNA